MLKKIKDTLKATALLCLCIFFPLWVGAKFIQMSLRADAVSTVESFMHDEGIGLSKYMGLQLENSRSYVDFLMSGIEDNSLKDAATAHDALVNLQKVHNDIMTVVIYNSQGKYFSSSNGELSDDLNLKHGSIKDIGDKCLFFITQHEDSGEVIAKFICLKQNVGGKKEKGNFYFEFVMKWDQYEKYMKNLEIGSFPRMLYVLSPDCRRYISLNSLPTGIKSNKTIVALGLHLASKVNSMVDGISEVPIDDKYFRVFKEKVHIADNLEGTDLYVTIATDDTAIDMVTANVMEEVSFVIIILIACWLILCTVLSRFYSATRDQLEISTTIADSTPLAIVIFRVSDGSIKQINLSAMTLIRVSKEDIAKINMWDIFISEGDKSYVSNAVSSNINVLNYEVLLQSFGGANLWSICSASPVEIEEQKYLVLAILDINRRKEIERKLANNAELLEKQVKERTADIEDKAKELEESNKKLDLAKAAADEANTAKSKFLTNMSNELKTPINAIVGYSEILKEEALDRKDTVSADDLRKIIGSAKHLLSLIDEILDLSNIEAGKTQMYFENIDIVDMIRDVEGVTMPLIADNDNSLFLEYPKDIGGMYTDSTKLRQCLLNLLSNAAKFTEFGRITLRAAPIVKDEVDFIEFSVVDTGVGISPDKIDKIFTGLQDGSGKSAGLGLSLTKRYTEFFGGTISVDSTEGIGSKFSIRIPRIAKVVSNEFIEVKNERIKEESENSDDESTAIPDDGSKSWL
ncbi:MAG: PAS domain-containing sensor histidine kinase [Holosporaceae bacterium]|jgi:PAS domain S-box-containing protein|nr:PAS domain-containing sensor histidine kinase [Holosporaceae bacterium]